jgi:von Willebrand factor type A domain
MTYALAALLLLQAPSLPPAEIRTVTVSITDSEGRAPDSLTPEEVAVLENGVARDIARVERDTRPLSVAILVDSSQEIQSAYRLYLIDAIGALIAQLPEGARYSLWTTGDRPRRLLGLTEDKGAATKALKRVVPSGGNTMLDALVEASEELRKREGDRTAVLAVTARTIDFSSRDRYRAVQEAQKNADLFLFVAIEEGTAPFESRTDYDYVIDKLTRLSGGSAERPLSAMGARKAILKVGAGLQSPWRVGYATVPEIKERRIEVQISRPGFAVRVGPTRANSGS